MAAEGRGDKRGDDSGLFARITVARASSSISEQIRGAIVSGKLKEGERLPPERELAAQFGVSRVTVRDALRALEAMGLIEVKVGARGGAFVTIPSGSVVGRTMSDMMILRALTPEDIVEARLVVELGIVTLACARATDEDIDQMRQLGERAQQALAAKTYTGEISGDFHGLLARMAHNRALAGLAGAFRSTLSTHPVPTREANGGHAETVDEHARILEAIERRDAHAARREMARHLLRGNGLEKQESQLRELWDAASTPGSKPRGK